ncbi:MAG: hypothetical protein OEM15_06600 [Myxococcales bacterium]|nr:hypothetical protein [Myxococcales bacterium]MDH3483379.1 hypothetical protein [Myxococcales bacterium]
MEGQVVGVDLDNTIICYDGLFHRLAVERGLVPHDFQPSKKLIRDQIRELPDGEIEWQKLQAAAYGPRIGEAGVFPGVRDFFATASARGVRTFIVSHKTRHAPYGDPEVSLREAAVEFLRAQGLVECLRDREADVFFTDTRQAKCRRVETLCCATFVDDLLETFREPEFPQTTERLLFDPLDVYSESLPELRFSSWAGITKHVFD